jgi:hypothetical protein
MNPTPVVTGWAVYGLWGTIVLTLLLAISVLYVGKEKLHQRLEDLLVKQITSNEALAHAVEALTETIKLRAEIEAALRGRQP